MGISFVLFDMDDVLCHYDRSARIRSLAALANRTFEEVLHAVWGSGLEAKADAGALDEASYLQATSTLLGCRVSKQDWLHARRAAMAPDFQVLALAKAVSMRCKIAVLTNNPQLVSENIAFLCPPVAELFGARVYASASFKATKPAAQTYQGCLDAMNVAASETLFIDDSSTNVAGALSAGLHSYLFTDHQALAAELRGRGLIDID